MHALEWSCCSLTRRTLSVATGEAVLIGNSMLQPSSWLLGGFVDAFRDGRLSNIKKLHLLRVIFAPICAVGRIARVARHVRTC